jgi:membrane protease YdiL (CAAX protease family)
MNDRLPIIPIRSQLGWFLLLVAGGLLVANLLAAIILLSSGTIAPGHETVDFANPRSMAMLKFLQGISTLITFLAPAWLFAHVTYRNRPWDNLGFHRASKNGFYLLAVVLLFVSMPFDGWLGQLNRAFPLPEWMIHREKEADQEIVAFLGAGSPAGILVNLFLIAVLPAICEEACFRGALQPLLIRVTKSPLTGIVLTAIVFSAFHMQFQGFLTRMFLGILLGAVYWYSGSLWVSIAAHFFTNAIQVVAVSYYPKFVTQDPIVPLPAALTSMILVAGLLLFLHHYSGQRDKYSRQGAKKPHAGENP